MLGLVTGELALRLTGSGQQGVYQWDTGRGWALRSGASGRQNRKGRAFVQINRDGLRDRERIVRITHGKVFARALNEL
jgi:hypothetical protein